MNANWSFYVTSVLVFLAIDITAGLGLNLQFGITGIYNFGFIVFQAVGAYISAVLSLGPSTTASGQTYILGAHLPFPIPWVLGSVAAAALALPIGAVCLRRLRGDYQAMVLLVFALLSTTVVTDYKGLFNGSAGLFGVPNPLSSSLGLSANGYAWFYVGLAGGIAIAVYLVVERLSKSPFGRVLRSIRENEVAAEAAGINVYKTRLKVFVGGAFLAGLSGAVMVSYVGAWSPGSWSYAETFVLLAALIVGGVGNNRGAILGIFLLPILLVQVVGFIPLSPGDAAKVASLQWVAIALVTLFSLWLWPRGALPEYRSLWAARRLRERAFDGAAPIAAQELGAGAVQVEAVPR